MELVVIRHTRLAIDAGICYGQSEIELADSYTSELETLKTAMPDSFAAVYASPLARCRQLAQAFHPEPVVDARLLEYDFGDWEMQAWNAIDTAALDTWMQDFVNQRPPNGETLVEMQARVSDFLQQLRSADHDRCLLVTHAGVIRCIWAVLLSIPLSEIFKLDVGYGKVLYCELGKSPEYDQVRVT